ncbi:uncharacterized protein FOMMEDRAFT_31251 [Fomitiporia mediterranea MF3/22]|uniref:uncharacterized protein n=1 Tax=Fomitiporia mediterranea (strain MF3/22) TaxID=694068 RepID=UPI0004407D19|nr:uncharacterized protein FOMMEDRAFT_31251 [Fomitiporia mediterranea MF3/22]EJC99137.1 hypothetical protein FOMMEDRAFT_31251 [Fomitiporia mediterranea MF3/22]
MYAFDRLGIPTLAVAHVKHCEKEIENALHALKDMKKAELQKATENKESARTTFKKAVDSFKVTKQACYNMCCSTFPECVVRSNHDKEIDEAMAIFFGNVLHYWRQYKEGINKLSTYCEKAYHKIKDKKETFLTEYDTGTLRVQDEKKWQERTDIMQKVDEIKEERQKVAEIMEWYYRERETLLQDTQQTMARFREFIGWKTTRRYE